MNFLAWYNILFLSALAVSVCVIVGAALGALHVGDGLGGGSDGGSGADGDGGAEGLDADAGGSAHAEGDLLDLGQLPFTVLLMTASLIFGLSGIAFSLVFTSVLGPDSALLGPIALIIALLVMVVLTTRLARLLIRHVPASETYVSSKRDLVGCEGEMFTRGFADVKARADVHRIACHPDTGLAPGTKIVVVDYDSDTKLYVVAPLER